MIKFAVTTFAMLMALSQIAKADYVGEVQTTKYLDPATINMISSRLQSGQAGLLVGDEISYFIQFTPTDNGGIIGAGGYVTDYIPAGTQVVNAQFVQLNADGSFSQIAPPPPAEVMAAYVPGVSDTGIFFSTDPRTAMYTSPASPTISTINGYAAMGGMTTHNLWDSQMVVAYSAAARIATVGCPLVSPWVATMGAGPVAGRDTVLKNDYTGGTGPWQRISYPGSYYGTMTGTVGTYLGCVGGVPTTAGWALSSSNPLPASTNAVRFAAGRVTVGELFSVRITLKITQPLPINGLINNTEVFGGDTSVKAPGTLIGKDVVWKYHIPNVANADTTLTVVKRVIGMCAGVGCVPQSFSGGAVPTLANLKLRYEITYLNSSGGPQTAVVLSDILPVGFTLVAGSEVVVTGPNILPTVPVVGGFSFQTLASLGSGSGGTVRFDVSTVAAPAVKTVISNTAKLVSLSLPGGVQSVATVSPTNTASVTMNVTTSTPTSAPGGTASYAVSLANNGAAGATLGPLVANGSVVFTLPSSGGALPTERFTFKPATGTMCGVTALLVNQACGVLTTPGVGVAPATTSYVVMAVTGNGVATALAPYTGLNREQITLKPTVLTTIPVGGKLDVTFGANVGTSVASSTVGYTSDVVVTYGGGFVTAPGVTTVSTSGIAPVKVDIPLSVTVAISCVYDALGVCNTYTSGSIPSNSKVKYRLDYKNTGAAQTNVILTNTLPTSTSFVVASASTSPQPTQLGQVLTFPVIGSLATGATGSVTFDVQLPLAAIIPSGSYITNSANIKSDGYLGGASGSLTTTVNDSANLTVTQTTTTPTLVKCTAVNVPVGCGQASYRITVANTGFTSASGIIVNELLPFTGTVVNLATTRFNYTAGSSIVAGMPNVVPTVLVTAPTMPGYTTSFNQQQVIWNFGVQPLAAGASFTIDYKADAGTSLAAGPTVYKSSVITNYNSGVTALIAADLNTASVTIPSNLSVTTTIDCVYKLPLAVPPALDVCDKYTGSGIIPVNAKVRYKMHYQNTALTPQTNVYLCNQITSTQLVPVFTATITQPTVAPTPTGPFADTPVIGVPAQIVAATPAATACGYSGVKTFAYPAIASLAAGASGDVYFDLTTNAAATTTVTNTGKMTNASGTETSSVSAYAQNTPVLQVTKSVTPNTRYTGETATYTITIKNTGNLATTSLKVFDFLPYSGTTADATKRFSYLATTGYTGGLVAPAIIAPETVSIPTNTPPNQSGYSGNTNQQQVKWDFGAYALAPGATVSITFTAQVGTAMPAGNYVNNVRAEFTSAAGAGNPTVTDTTDQVTVSSPTTWADIELTKTNSVTSILAGGTTSYTITVKNISGDSASGIKIVDPAATGLSKTSVSCTSSGFSCPVVSTIADLEGTGIVLTPFNAGATATITVGATVSAVSGSVTNAVNAILPSGLGDSTSATPTTVNDTDTVLISDLSANSTITWVDNNGGSHEPGDTITFTVTLKESGGITATAVNLTDTIPAGLTNLTVTGLGGGTDNSTATFVDIRSITVPANGQVTITFTATIAAGTATGTAINNTATATNPTGTGASLAALTITVGTPATSGTKDLYLSSGQAAAPATVCVPADGALVLVPTNCSLSRTVTPNTVPANTAFNITRGGHAIWQLTPALQSAMTLNGALTPVPNANTIPVTLNLSTSRNGLRMQLDVYCSTTPATVATLIPPALGVIAVPTAAPYFLPLPVAPMTCGVGGAWMLKVTHTGGVRANRWITVTPVTATLPAAKVELPSANVINVDSVASYSVPFTNVPNTTTVASYASGNTVYLRAVVSDPFGSADITAAKIAISKPDGTYLNPLTGTLTTGTASTAVTGTGTFFTTELAVGDVIRVGGSYYTVMVITSNTALTLGRAVTTGAASLTAYKALPMTPVADSLASTKTFEYAYAIPTTPAPPSGVWNADVIGIEGSEGKVNHTRAGGFVLKPPVDHYEIKVPQYSTACMPTTVTITACQDASNPCTAASTGINSSVTIAATAGSLSATTFNLVSGVGTSTLTYPLAGNDSVSTISLGSTTDAPTNGATCAGGAGGCATTFKTNGIFVVTDTNGVNAASVSIPTQVAGVDSATYYLRGIKTNPTTQACETLLKSSTSVGVGYKCIDPAGCYAANLLAVNGGTGTTTIGRDDAIGATAVTFDFAATNNAAPFKLNYSDVGNIELHFHKVHTTGATLDGASNVFRVDPHHFDVKACTSGTSCTVANASATNGSGAIFAKAGQAFQATITAMSALNTATPSYGTAHAATKATEMVTLTNSLVAPSPGASGAFAGTAVTAGVARSSFTNGVVTTLLDLTWSEVGVMTLTANATSFMNATPVALASPYNCIAPAVTCGTSGNVGRFVPDHFDTVVTGTMDCGSGLTCPTSTKPMVYSGQPFASVMVKAMNAATPAVLTSNYTGAFEKTVTISAASSNGGAAIATGGVGEPKFTPTAVAGFSGGSKTVSGTAAPAFTFAAPTPPNNPTDVYVRATDADTPTAIVSGGTGSTEGGVKVVSGRIKIGNAFGSELLPLPIPLTVQFYNGSGWVQSSTDLSTKIDTNLTTGATGNVKTTGMTVSVNSPSIKTVSKGSTSFTFAAPNAKGNTVVSMINSTGNDISYLLTNSIIGQATFGVYAGRKEFIYLRENY